VFVFAQTSSQSDVVAGISMSNKSLNTPIEYNAPMITITIKNSQPYSIKKFPMVFFLLIQLPSEKYRQRFLFSGSILCC
jgi:hypothetical protein